MALDAGTAGVLVPYCETVEEVQAVVATAHWHPLKGEYLRRAVEEGELPSAETRKYLRNRRKESFVVIGIESEPAWRNLDAILDVGGIDGVFIGPNDMSTSLGIPDDYANPRVPGGHQGHHRPLYRPQDTGDGPPADPGDVDHGDRPGGALSCCTRRTAA